MGRAGDRARTLLSLLSVGLGVGVVLAIQIANRAAIGSFQDSLIEISGRANLSILGTNRIDEEVLPRLTALVGADVKLSPVMESLAVVKSSREIVSVLGLDVLQDSPFRDNALAGAAPSPREFLLLLADPYSLIVGESFAARYQLKPGMKIELFINDRASEYTVRGILAPTGPAKALAGNLVLMDIAYYLIFSAYILFTINFSRQLDWQTTVGAEQLQSETVRVGGMLLLLGVLHGLNVLSLPVIGRLLAIAAPQPGPAHVRLLRRLR